MITIKNLTKSYGNILALDNISVEFQAGIHGLVGPNGSGKSTLLNIIAGLLYPDHRATEIKILGSSNYNQASNNELGVLLEDAFYPLNMTAMQYISYSCKIREMSPEKPLQMLQDLNVPLNRPIGGLSAGTYQKFGVTLALSGDPKVVLLDEPTTSLDPISRKKILKTIETCYETDGISFIISSHVLGELESIAHYITLLNSGKILDQARPAEFRKKWQKPGEFEIMTKDVAKLLHLIQNSNKMKLLDKTTTRVRFQWHSTTTGRETNNAQLLEVLKFLNNHEIEVIEMKRGCDLDHVYWRLMND